MTSKIALITAACLLVSCTTVATKRPELKPSTTKTAAAGKKGKGISGMTTGKPPAQPQGQTAGAQPVPAAPVNVDPLVTLKGLVTQSVQAPTPQEQEVYRTRAVEIVDNRLNEKQLEEVADNSDYGFVRGNAMYRLGEKALDERDLYRAKKYLSGVVDYLPGSDLALRSQDIIAQLNAAKNVESKTVGVVLPLSGKTLRSVSEPFVVLRWV